LVVFACRREFESKAVEYVAPGAVAGPQDGFVNSLNSQVVGPGVGVRKEPIVFFRIAL